MKKRTGFSLMELMLLLVTFSIVCAAMAPVFTKRVRSINTAANPSKVSQNCSSRFSGYCTSCNLRECLTCDRLCTQTQATIIATCSCKNCSELFTNCYQCSERRCTKCKQGYYKAGDTDEAKTATNTCTICPKGHYCDGYNKIPCPKGWVQPATGQDHCENCLLGQYQDEEGKTDCKTCPAGYYCPKKALAMVVRCPAGHYSAAGKSACTACPSGQVPNNKTQAAGTVNGETIYDGQSGCVNCAAGTASHRIIQKQSDKKFYSTQNVKIADTEAQLPTGGGIFDSSALTHSCHQCQEGTYSVGSKGYCINCPAGYYSRRGAANSCTKCPVGTFSGVEGSSTCSDCSDGEVSTDARTSCSQCAKGTVSVAHKGSCTSCSPGYYAPNNGMGACVPCPAGQYNTGYGNYSCTKCPIGQYQNQEGKTSCISCPKGTEAPSMGFKECRKCAAGYYSQGGAGGCQVCQSGYYSPGGGDSSTCKPCPKGTYRSNDTTTLCIPCAGGYVNNSVGKTSCSRCGANTYSSPDGTTCLACPSGTTSTAGSSYCQDPDPTDQAPDNWY